MPTLVPRLSAGDSAGRIFLYLHLAPMARVSHGRRLNEGFQRWIYGFSQQNRASIGHSCLLSRSWLGPIRISHDS